MEFKKTEKWKTDKKQSTNLPKGLRGKQREKNSTLSQEGKFKESKQGQRG